LVVLIASLCVGLAACSVDHESFYSSLADADRDGAISRGWIPIYLPASSHAIHEAHDQSPEYEWCSFEFSPEDTERLSKTLQPVDAVIPVKKIRNPHRSWWPRVLTGNLDAQESRKEGFELYAVVDPATVESRYIWLFAVDWRRGHAYFYSTHYDNQQ